MDCISVLKEMIHMKDPKGSCDFLILIVCYILSITYAPIS